MNNLAVVIASACCWEDDMHTFLEGYESPVDVIAVNDAGWLYEGDIDHWVTLHPEHFPVWLDKRPTRDGILFWTGADRTHRYDGVDFNTVGHWGAGSSTLFAVTVGLYMGYSRMVLCGAPMVSVPHAAGASEWDGKPWPNHEVQVHRQGWTYHKDRIAGSVRSMSGWTRDLLGAPDAEFLYDRTHAHRLMARNTVRPPLDADGNVLASYWHCVACGSTRLYRMNISHQTAYHCGDCGREFSVDTKDRPWYALEADEISTMYPPEMADG